VELSATIQGGEDFEFWWNNRGEPVEEPNRRRGGISGVETIADGEQRLYCKRQQGHLYRSLRYPLGRPTVLREAKAIVALRQLDVLVPEITYSGVRFSDGQWQGLLVTQALEGFVNLEDWFADGEHRDRRVDSAVLQALATTLVRMHRGRWQHGCLYPKHLFVKVPADQADPAVMIALLDLEKSRRRVTCRAAARHDLQQLHRQWRNVPGSQWPLLLNFYLELAPFFWRAALHPDHLTWVGGSR